MTTTNYNDGQWHGWSSGECPVHPNTKVRVMLSSGFFDKYDIEAEDLEWDHKTKNIVAFKVTEEYKEPREYWLCYNQQGDEAYVHEFEPKDYSYYHKVIHVREVETND
jgi:hypothetical protein